LHDFTKILQLKDAAQLALKRMPSAEQEAISQVSGYSILFIIKCGVLILGVLANIFM
jgi:hypothetical protein